MNLDPRRPRSECNYEIGLIAVLEEIPGLRLPPCSPLWMNHFPVEEAPKLRPPLIPALFVTAAADGRGFFPRYRTSASDEGNSGQREACSSGSKRWEIPKRIFEAVLIGSFHPHCCCCSAAPSSCGPTMKAADLLDPEGRTIETHSQGAEQLKIYKSGTPPHFKSFPLRVGGGSDVCLEKKIRLSL